MLLPTDLRADFPTVLKRIKLLGFNAIRLPFTFRWVCRCRPGLTGL